MFIVDLLTALFVAGVFSALFIPLFGYGRDKTTTAWAGISFFFLIVWLVTWSLAVWVTPFGPTVYGAAVMPFLLIGLIAALVLAAATTRNEPRKRIGGRATAGGPALEEQDGGGAVLFGAFFWILMLVLIAALFARYGFRA
jgi:hypothetical protein